MHTDTRTHGMPLDVLAWLSLDEAGIFTHVHRTDHAPGDLAPALVGGDSPVGRSAFDVWADEPALAAHVRRVLDGAAFSANVPGPGGRSLRTQWLPCRGRDGAVVGALVVLLGPDGAGPESQPDREMREANQRLQQEIAGRERVEASLAASNRMLEQERKMFINGPVAVFKWRNEPGWPVEYVSPNIEQISGYPVTAFLSGEIVYAALIPEADIGRVVQEVATFSAAGGANFEHHPYRLQRRDGKEIWIADYTTILRDPDGGITHYLGYIIDITERQEAQEQLRRAKEELEERVRERTRELSEAKDAAEAANRAKSEFLANMSHELRTPLNAILGYAQILKRNPRHGRQSMNGLDIIQQGGEHLLTLINDILDLSKIEARKLELVSGTFDFRGFLVGISEIARQRARERALSFVFEMDDALPRAVEADEKRLRQVLINLLGNAAKFTDQGEVVFRVGRQAQPPGGDRQQCRARVHFEVSDTGVGMTAEEQRGIFTPFEQYGQARHRAEGTGLGLAISQRLVRAMGSEIEVTSEPGVGSTFAFAIEVLVRDLPEVRAAAGEREITGYRGPRRSLLVADDRVFNRMVIKDVLTPLGFSILEADNGEQAVAMALEHRPDVVLMDLVMPVMTGFEAVRRLRSDPASGRIVIIATSASVFSEDQKHSLIAGCDAFLPKPVELDRLFELLEERLGIEWIAGEAAESERAADVAVANTAHLLAPPAEVIAELYDAAIVNDMDGLARRVERLVASAAEYQPFARELEQRFAAAADTDRVLAFIEQFM